MNSLKARSMTIVAACALSFISVAAFAASVGGRMGSAPVAKPATSAKSTTTTHTTGQPNQSCGSLTAPNTPGNAASAPGSAFNPDGNAGTKYAGQQPQNSKNPTSVSQYDVACSHQPH
jgi:hypothetical protein